MLHRFKCHLLTLLLMVCSVWLAGCGVYQRVTLAVEVRHADRRFDEKRYLVARAMYRRLVEKLPEGPKREELMLKIGKCFYNDKVLSLHDARIAYLEYLERYPEGAHVEEARRSIEEIELVKVARENATEERRRLVRDKIAKIRAAIERDPDNTTLYDDADLHFQLGNALWDLERYEEACRAYVHAQDIDAKYVQNETIEERVMLDQEGVAHPLTPATREAIRLSHDPLVVFDTNVYNSRLAADFLNTREVYFNVQGLVRNQSPETQRNVVVEVRFYNPARQQLDVQHAQIGDMPPRAVRAFGVQASRYDNIYNIASYECHPYAR